MSIYAGIDPAVLQSRLTAAQDAYDVLATGSKVVSVRLGDKAVSYSPADPGALDRLARYIRELQAALGLTPALVRGVYIGGGKGV